MTSVSLDVNDRRVRLEATVSVDLLTGSYDLPHVELDSGSAWALVVHADLLGPLPEDRVPDNLHGFGGVLEIETFRAALRFGPWLVDVDVAVARFDEVKAWVGIPLLRHFDLLLRAVPGDPHRPCLLGPSPEQRLTC